ncbi:MAG TPA: pyridoxal phosphate-dependent aminotransferase [Puia sp.]|nr:pyridoxal phosphate-dependent aminotransferase [Puia sp.]
MFDPNLVDLATLRQRAYNLRWATVPEGVIPLTAADPDFPCAPAIADAIGRYVGGRYFSYGPPEGLPAFKESLAIYFRDKRNIPAIPEWVLPVDSAAYGIYLTCKTFLAPGDEAIIFDPVDFLFRYSIEAVMARAVPFAIPPGPLLVDFDRLEKLITKKTRMICLCNPLNPTGKVFTRTELIRLGEIACKYDLLILSDEIWSDIVYQPNAFTSIASLGGQITDRTVTVTGFSKSYGLAGLRIGAVMASDRSLYQRLFNASLHKSTIHGANTIAQVAATAALTECGEWLKEFVGHLQAMRDLCVARLNAVPGFVCIPPEGCYVAFVNITGTGRTAAEIQELLFTEARVAVVPGLKEWFGEGADGYIRLSYATSEKILSNALDRINTTILPL